MYQDTANFYLQNSDGDVRNAYVQGYLMAMRMYNHPLPATGSLEELRSWISAAVLSYELKAKERIRAQVRQIFEAYGFDKDAFRGFILDTAHVSADGRETDENGNPISDEHGNLLPGAEHRAWPDYFYVDKAGNRVPEGHYTAYMKVQYMDVMDGCNVVFQITSLDEAAIEECLMLDISTGDPIRHRYEFEARAGTLEDYAGAIERAWNAMPKRFAKHSPMCSAKVIYGKASPVGENPPAVAGRVSNGGLQKFAAAAKKAERAYQMQKDKTT